MGKEFGMEWEAEGVEEVLAMAIFFFYITLDFPRLRPQSPELTIHSYAAEITLSQTQLHGRKNPHC